MTKRENVDVAIIGAGPYGLSVAAHLAARGVDYRMFGSPMHTWRHGMPKGMLLRSPGFGSNLCDPVGEFTLARFWSKEGRTAESLDDPIPLDVYCRYGQWFIDELGLPIEDVHVERLSKLDGGFTLDLETGERVAARQVVVAVGLTHYAHVPSEIASLGSEFGSHSSMITDPADFAGRDVVVLGAGQSALENGALLHEAGARVRIIARRRQLDWTGERAAERSLSERLLRPEGGLCVGWPCIGYEYGAALFPFMPERRRHELVRTRFGPMGAWWLRPRLEDVTTLLGHSLASANVRDGEVDLELRSTDGVRKISTEHVVAATGYRVDLRRLTFLDDGLRRAIRLTGHAPALSRSFESSVDGLRFVGAPSAMTFGPVTRFVVGARFTARVVANHLDRRRRVH